MNRESNADLQIRLILEKRCRQIADTIKHLLPAGTGFSLWLFDFGLPGNLAYVSSADRDDMLRLIAEWLSKQDGGKKAMLDRLVPDGDAIEVVSRLVPLNDAGAMDMRSVVYLAIRKAENEVLEWAAKQADGYYVGGEHNGLPNLAAKIRSIKVNL
jgi:hypothetical protein